MIQIYFLLFLCPSFYWGKEIESDNGIEEYLTFILCHIGSIFYISLFAGGNVIHFPTPHKIRMINISF